MTLILKGGTVVTMNTGRQVLSDYDLLLDQETIVKIASTGSITKGQDTEELSCHGKITLPGFVSAHSHCSMASAQSTRKGSKLKFLHCSRELAKHTRPL
jgi:dihydroorotase-like cyclic amidohydrolase